MTQALNFEPFDEETLGPADISNPSTPVPHILPDNIFMMSSEHVQPPRADAEPAYDS
jgi:hypothetical protein